MATTVLKFAAQLSETLPPFIVPFAHPVHTELALSKTTQAMVEDLDMEMHNLDGDVDVVAPIPDPETPSGQSSNPVRCGQPSALGNLA